MTQALSAAEILATWERAANAHPVDRALAILATWRPDLSHDAIVGMSLGRRDALLIRARQATFGDSLPAHSSCPACHETIEFDLSCSALRIEAGDFTSKSEIDLEIDGLRVRARPLDSSDLASIAGCDVEESRRRLISRCVLHATRDGIRVAAEALPESVCCRLAAALAEADPQSDITLELRCVACAHTWVCGFDIGRYLWTEIAARAKRLIQEVHALATAFGWSERDILSMSAARRAAYLDLLAT